MDASRSLTSIRVGFFDLFDDRIAKEEVRLEMEAAGYRLINAYDLLDRQHFQIFAGPDSKQLDPSDAKDAAPKDRE